MIDLSTLGSWIEIMSYIQTSVLFLSLPPRVCRLKSYTRHWSWMKKCRSLHENVDHTQKGAHLTGALIEIQKSSVQMTKTSNVQLKAIKKYNEQSKYIHLKFAKNNVDEYSTICKYCIDNGYSLQRYVKRLIKK